MYMYIGLLVSSWRSTGTCITLGGLLISPYTHVSPWGSTGITLRVYWYHPGGLLVSPWGSTGITLRVYWYHPGGLLVSPWGSTGISQGIYWGISHVHCKLVVSPLESIQWFECTWGPCETFVVTKHLHMHSMYMYMCMAVFGLPLGTVLLWLMPVMPDTWTVMSPMYMYLKRSSVHLYMHNNVESSAMQFCSLVGLSQVSDCS